MADYKRRVSPTATIEARYESWFYDLEKFEARNLSFPDYAYKKQCIPGELGFAAGGQMYDPPLLRLSIVLLTLHVPERRKYIQTKIRPGYDVVAF